MPTSCTECANAFRQALQGAGSRAIAEPVHFYNRIVQLLLSGLLFKNNRHRPPAPLSATSPLQQTVLTPLDNSY
jgi:hypothetical protein